MSPPTTQVLREDLHRPQGVGAHGAAQPGRHADRQLLKRPDRARVGRGIQRVQGRAEGARARGGVHLLGPRERLPQHHGGHRLRGTSGSMSHSQHGLCMQDVGLEGCVGYYKTPNTVALYKTEVWVRFEPKSIL